MMKLDYTNTQKEAEEIFRNLNEANRRYAMAVLQSLQFAQEVRESEHTTSEHTERET